MTDCQHILTILPRREDWLHAAGVVSRLRVVQEVVVQAVGLSVDAARE